MRLWRVFPWNAGAETGDHGHPLWIPRTLQGAGRHDNPDLYGALYLSEGPVAAIAENIAHLRGQGLDDADLERGGLRLALQGLDAFVEGRLWDLDNPQVLVQRRLRPSIVATHERSATRRWAADLFRARPHHDGIRWWSSIEASWIHVTLFHHRVLARLGLVGPPERLHVGHESVREAAAAVGVRIH